jgi:hypothetical protein
MHAAILIRELYCNLSHFSDKVNIFNLESLGKLFKLVCQRLATGRWFSPVPPVSSTNKTDRQDITEILLGGVKHHKT